MPGDFDDSQHPRDDRGRFVSEGGGGSGHSLAEWAKAMTRHVVDLARHVAARQPKIDAPGEQHSEHARQLRNVAQGNLDAAQAHNDAAREARKEGKPEEAKEHADAALAHAQAAREKNHEADEHAAIGRTDRQAHEEDHAAIAKGAHEAAEEAAHHQEKASASKERDKGEEKPGEREEEKEHEGLASWVKEKLKGAREGLHEKLEAAKEAEEQALEGNVYRAGLGAAKATLGAVGSQVAKKATGGVVGQLVRKHLEGRLKAKEGGE